jgi:hypothetical protein
VAADRERIETSARELHYRANAAIGDLDALMSAADAARRTGSWQPAAARTPRDFEELARGQDILVRQQRRQRR